MLGVRVFFFSVFALGFLGSGFGFEGLHVRTGFNGAWGLLGFTGFRARRGLGFEILGFTVVGSVEPFWVHSSLHTQQVAYSAPEACSGLNC